MQSSFENKPCLSHSIFNIKKGFEEINFFKLNYYYQFVDKTMR